MNIKRSTYSVSAAALAMCAPLFAAPAFHLQMSLAQEDIRGNRHALQRYTGALRYATSTRRDNVINLHADIYHQTYPDIASWDSNGLLLEAIYNLLPTAGYTQPMYSLLLRHETSSSNWIGEDYSQSTLILADRFRLDDRQSIAFGGEWANRSQGGGASRLLGVFLNTDIDISEHLLVYINLKLQQQNNQAGYSDLYAPISTRRLRTHNASEDTSINYFVTLGANYPFNAHHSIDLSWQSARYDMDGANDSYSLFSFDYFYKF